MTALEIVQAAYPGIPVAILNQFAPLLPAEASAIDHDFSSIYFDTWKTLPTFQQITLRGAVPWPNGVPESYNRLSANVVILSPKNPDYTTSQQLQQTVSSPISVRRNSTPPIITPHENTPWGQVTGTINVQYDKRLYKPFVLELVNTNYTPAVVDRNWNPIGSVYYALTNFTLRAKSELMPFDGVETICIMYENGRVFSDIDYDALYTFRTYIRAYKKFATQIDAEKNLLEQQARNTVNAYRQQLDDQAAREYADLQAKKIQLLIAIDNDAKSAQRDFQNMLLTAQGLKNQIGGNLV